MRVLRAIAISLSLGLLYLFLAVTGVLLVGRGVMEGVWWLTCLGVLCLVSLLIIAFRAIGNSGTSNIDF